MKCKLIRRELFLLCLISLISSCISNDERQLKSLVTELGIEFTCESDSNYLVIIPGNGCESCIQDAIDEIQESNDTVYVFICDSEKDFNLQSGGRNSSSFKNVFLDKRKLSVRLGLVSTYLQVYLLVNGGLVSKSPYRSRKRLLMDKKLTMATTDKTYLDFGKVKFGETYKDSICIINRGNEPLFINGVRSSCDCTEIKVDSKVIAPLERVFISVMLKPDVKGEFERFVFVDCNVRGNVLEIPIKGNSY